MRKPTRQNGSELDERPDDQDEDDLARGEMMAKESLTVYMRRTRKALEEIDAVRGLQCCLWGRSEDKILKRDRERLEKKMEEAPQRA